MNDSQKLKGFTADILSIARELNGERNIDRLLSLTLEKTIEVTGADAGSIYTVERQPQKNDDDTEPPESLLRFQISINRSVVVQLQKSLVKISHDSIVGACVLNRTAINSTDVPNDTRFKHNSSFDKKYNYQSKTMLTLPIFNISNDVTGVVQLINRKIHHQPLKKPEDFINNIVPFDDSDIEIGQIITHQAGIAMENALLTQQKKDLFEGFVEASVKAIEQRDPTTSGHSHRVAHLTLQLAEAVNKVHSGPLRDHFFNDQKMLEIRYAALLHDFGKLGVREEVLVKSKKLYPYELQRIKDRFDLIKMRRLLDYSLENRHICCINDLRHHLSDEFAYLDHYFAMITHSCEPNILEKESMAVLSEIAKQKYLDIDDQPKPFLSDIELSCLQLPKGSLGAKEIHEIQMHVSHTYAFLRTIPWGDGLEKVPEIAGKHHEKMDGSGYPFRLKGEQIPLQSRMMTITDIYDALTAADRPYKKATTPEKALDIIEMEVKAGKCDSHLFQLFVEAKVFEQSPSFFQIEDPWLKIAG